MLARYLSTVLTLAVQLHATAIALIVTPKFVVIATDSKAVDAHGSPSAQVCKIRKAGEIFYVANKFVSHHVIGYDLNQVILKIRADSVTDLASKVAAAVAGPLNRALIKSRQEDAVAFKSNFATGQAMGIVFVAFENGAPAVVDLRFIILTQRI